MEETVASWHGDMYQKPISVSNTTKTSNHDITVIWNTTKELHRQFLVTDMRMNITVLLKVKQWSLATTYRRFAATCHSFLSSPFHPEDGRSTYSETSLSMY